MKQQLLTILDIGTSKVVCLIGRFAPMQPLEIIGVGHQLAEGFKSGVITDMKCLENAVLSAIDQAEQMAKVRVEKVVVNMSGAHVHSSHISADIPLGSHPVGVKETHKVIQAALSKLSLDKHELIHHIPLDYRVDEAEGIQDPLGLFGKKLVVQLHAVTGSTNMMANIAHCLTKCQLDVEEMVVSPYASALACLTLEEMQHGTLLIDMGAGMTSLAICHRGKLVFTHMIPIGGMHITSDLAYGLSSSLHYAERIKTLHGYAIPDRNRMMELIDIPAPSDEHDVDEHDTVSVLRGELDHYATPRVEEMLDMIEKAIDDHHMRAMIRKSVVLTGGASQLMRMKEAVSERFGKPARLASPAYPHQLPNYLRNPAFSTACGMIQFMVQHYHAQMSDRTSSIKGAGVARRMLKWLQENF